MVNIVSFNVNGLRNTRKLDMVFSLLQESFFDIVLLQETFWDDTYLSSVLDRIPGTVYSSNANNNRRGVAIVVSPRWKDNITLVGTDDDGRFLHTRLSIEDREVDIINIYATNSAEDRNGSV